MNGFVQRGLGENFRNFLEAKMGTGNVDAVYKSLLVAADAALAGK